ncbi:Quinate repressor protein [Ceratocystis platani]|uniref:Quinate repressor protein n=1 Tax=Ceratocystis fimbriata f. sp. platani TaxID=88771 RepID=A0A0F8AWJ6_CERFI|nr:Quinate repressor protein [Ceratocystis platani]
MASAGVKRPYSSVEIDCPDPAPAPASASSSFASSANGPGVCSSASAPLGNHPKAARLSAYSIDGIVNGPMNSAMAANHRYQPYTTTSATASPTTAIALPNGAGSNSSSNSSSNGSSYTNAAIASANANTSTHANTNTNTNNTSRMSSPTTAPHHYSYPHSHSHNHGHSRISGHSTPSGLYSRSRDPTPTPMIPSSTMAYQSPHSHSHSHSHSLPPTARGSLSGPSQGHDPDHREPVFASLASIVLVGIRGSGKSTLAIIASTAMKRRVIDCEKTFQQAMRISSAAYMKAHSATECHRVQAAILRDVLRENSQRCIIVCSWIDRSILSLLRDFSRSNPVIQILRDPRAIQEHLKIETIEKTRNIVNASTAIFRACSNLEFFNISERIRDVASQNLSQASDPPDDTCERRPAPYLALKRAERHFLKFLSLVMPNGSIPFIESAFPLASIPTEDRRFTYATSVRLTSLIQQRDCEIDIEELETGADAIEIIVDDIDVLCGGSRSRPPPVGTLLDPERATNISKVIGNIRRDTVIPIIYHVLLPTPNIASDTAAFHALYKEYLLHGLRLACEYITIDLRLSAYEIDHITTQTQNSKLIGHFACPPSAPPSQATTWLDPMWMAHYHRARLQGCDLVRFVKPVATIKDNFDINQLKSKVEALDGPKVPLIAFNSGNRGRHSAVMNHVLTSVATQPTVGFVPDTPHPPSPRITAQQATQALYASFLFDPMKLYVFGARVDYSLSPAIHNGALAALGIPHHYRPHSTQNLRGLKELIDDPYFAGASIGLPFKVEIIALTHSLSRHARAIGAVNTLIPVRRLNPDGSIPEDETLFNCRNRAGPVRALYGDNTDWVGIRACLRRGLSPANAVRPTSCGLVIGAGGMARAAVYAMLQLGVTNIVIFNRTASNAEKLVAHFTQLLQRKDLPLLSPTTTLDGPEMQARFHVIHSIADPWPANFRCPTMIVVCIPIHSIGDVPAPHFVAPSSWLESPTGGVLIDLGYKTLDTPIINQARALAHRGWVAMDGLDLLPEQGFAQFELFTGRRAPRRLMRRYCLQAYTDEQGRSNLAHLQPRLNNIMEQEP